MDRELADSIVRAAVRGALRECELLELNDRTRLEEVVDRVLGSIDRQRHVRTAMADLVRDE
jgi:hypothetical protein